MKKPRGNKTSKAERTDRQAQVLEKMKAGETNQTALAAHLGVSRVTLWRDLCALQTTFLQAVSSENMQELRRLQVEAMEKTAAGVLDGSVPPDVANAWVRLKDSVAKILGLNAESRAVVAHVTTESSPLFLKFKKATYGLTDLQIEAALDHLAKLPREKIVTVMDANWFPAPEPKLLERSDD